MAEDPTDLRGWPLGMDNVHPDYALPPGSLRSAVNVDVLDSGTIRRRKGFTLAYDATNPHSLWATGQGDALFVEGDELKSLRYLSGAWVDTILDTGFTGRRVWYVNLNGETLYSNGVKHGVYANSAIRAWGVETPAAAPAVGLGTGILAAGRYQLAITYVTASGEESGASVSVAYQLAADGGIFVSGITQPIDSGVSYIRVYCTPMDGDVFYRVVDLAVGTTSYNLASYAPGMPLRTQFMRQFPPCTHLQAYNGRIYGVDGADPNTVLFTQPLRYGLTIPDKDFLLYAAPVSIIAPVTDGVYIAADRTRFLSWDPDGETPTQRDVLPYGAVSGTLGAMSNNMDVFWFSTEGVVVASVGGQVKNVMNTTVAVDDYESGVSMLREQDGVSQIVCSLTGKGDTSAFTCTDYAEAEIIRRARS